MLAETHEGLVENLNFVVWKAFSFKLPLNMRIGCKLEARTKLIVTAQVMFLLNIHYVRRF